MSQLNPPNFDTIVIGLGSMGAAACYYLAKRGCNVLGLEQFNIPHERGLHTGQSRLIRKAYFEHPDYVPLLQRAYENWTTLEEQAETKLLHQTGLVYFARPQHPLIAGIELSAQQYKLPLQHYSQEQTAQQFPAFAIPDSFTTILEPEAGFVPAEKAISVYYELAVRQGAQMHAQETVLNWGVTNGDAWVETNKGTYHAQKLIFTAGAWSAHLLKRLNIPLKVTRQLLAWVRPKQWENYTLGNFPCWMIADDEYEGVYYGFPILPAAEFGSPVGLKVAHHLAGEEIDPDSIRREPSAVEETMIRYVLEKYLPGSLDAVLSLKTCLYTYSPDEDFIVDFLPDFEDKVVIACGFSGHGFKFSPVIGEILADLAMNGSTTLPIEFLRIRRFF